ncbi:CTD kinase subunit beta [Kwoniella heveanensis BCC8398]|uniref:CTD kinase subunit beta n=1 Tax=Kwoniella heveanensis BCC8398 TaxID=1296120 RepID=A0A1B9GME6_9TREE|nr:CTD kinase subunit beta [Kwoniella heveanensis BCC8398]
MTVPSSSSSTSHVKHYKPYFTPLEVERLSAKQRGKLSVSREERLRQQACGFIDAVGVRCGFPRRTIATAQTLYMRFHLFFPYKDFNYLEVSLSTLYVSSKLHDTIKKPRDIILASFPIRYPNLVRKGGIDPATAEAHGLEHERKGVLNCERLVLETMGFKFGVEVGLSGVIKIGKRLGLDKSLCQSAWQVAIDCHRTQAALSYPPHVIALGSIYTSTLLLRETTDPLEAHERSSMNASSISAAQVVRLLGNTGSWETEYSATAGDIDDIAHALIDLYTTILSLLPDLQANIHTPSPVSPIEPGTTSSQSTITSTPSPTAFPLPIYWTTQTLTELKIKLRERRPGGPPATTGWSSTPVEGAQDEEGDEAVEGMGRNDGTVRFLWDEGTVL